MNVPVANPLFSNKSKSKFSGLRGIDRQGVSSTTD